MISNDLHKFRNTAPQLQLEIKLKRHEKQNCVLLIEYHYNLCFHCTSIQR